MNSTGTKYVRIMKLHFEEGKKRRVYTVFKIFSTNIYCNKYIKCNFRG